MRTYNDPLTSVDTDHIGRPITWAWHGHTYTLTSVIEHWVTQDAWWELLEASATPRAYEHWLVTAHSSAGTSRIELSRVEDSTQWRLVSIDDSADD